MMPPALTELFSTITAVSWRASWLILALVVLRRMVRGRIPAQVWFVVWIVVAVRLLSLVSLPANWSPFNVLPAHTTVTTTALARGAALPMPRSIVPSTPDLTVSLEPTPAPVSTSAITPPAEGRASQAEAAFPLAILSTSTSSTPAARPVVPVSPPTAASIAPALPAWTVLEIAALAWLAGIALLGVARLVALARFHRRLRSMRSTSDVRLAETVAREATALGGPGHTPVCLETNAVDAPALFGILRPRLLFPPGLAAQLTDDELRLVVRHELAHWRRRDLLAQALLQAAAVLHWFNPLVWFAARLARTDCELACDEFVLRRETAGGITAYGSTLLKVLGVTPGLRRRPAASVGIFESKQELAQRVRTIAGYRAATRLSLVGGIALVAGLATASLTRESRAAANAPAIPLATARETGESAPLATKEALKKAALDPGATLARIYNIQERRKKGLPLSELYFVATDRRVGALREKVTKQEAKVEMLSQRYTESHPIRKTAETELQQFEADLQHVAEVVCREIEVAYAAINTRQAPTQSVRPTVFAAQSAPQTPSAPATRSAPSPVPTVDRRTLERALLSAQRELRAREEEFQAARNELGLARAATARMETRQGQIRNFQDRKKTLSDLSFVADQPLVMRLKQDLVNGRIEGASLRGRYGDSHPEVVALAKRMEQISVELDRTVLAVVEQVEAEYQTAIFHREVSNERQDLAQNRLRMAEDELDKIQARIDATTPPSIAAESAALVRPADDFVVRVIGAVNQQGSVAFSAQDQPIVLDVIAHAGGFTPRADRQAIRVVSTAPDGKRTSRTLGEKEVMEVYSSAEGFFAATRLAPGDVVVVSELPVSPGEVSVVGAVNTPGVIALSADGKITLAALLAKAGGPTRLSNLRQVRVVRMENGEKKVFNIDMSDLQRADANGSAEWLNFVLKPGDTIFLPERIL